MNKEELIKAVSYDTEFTRGNATIAVNAVFDIIFDEIANGGKVSIKDFGIFETTQVKSRKFLSFDKTEEIEKPAHVKAKFRASKHLKETLESNVDS